MAGRTHARDRHRACTPCAARDACSASKDMTPVADRAAGSPLVQAMQRMLASPQYFLQEERFIVRLHAAFYEFQVQHGGDLTGVEGVRASVRALRPADHLGLERKRAPRATGACKVVWYWGREGAPPPAGTGTVTSVKGAMDLQCCIDDNMATGAPSSQCLCPAAAVLEVLVAVGGARLL